MGPARAWRVSRTAPGWGWGICYQPLCMVACVSRDSIQTLVDREERRFSEPRPHLSYLPTPLRQLVNAGVLTVRDAGSWWLAVPGAGRFIKYFVKGILPAAQAPSPSRTSFGGSSGLQALPFPTPVPCLLQGARLSSAWFGRPSTGSYSFQSSWAGGHLPRYDSALPTTCMTSLGPSWWTGESCPQPLAVDRTMTQGWVFSPFLLH